MQPLETDVIIAGSHWSKIVEYYDNKTKAAIIESLSSDLASAEKSGLLSAEAQAKRAQLQATIKALLPAVAASNSNIAWLPINKQRDIVSNLRATSNKALAELLLPDSGCNLSADVIEAIAPRASYDYQMMRYLSHLSKAVATKSALLAKLGVEGK